MKTDAATETSLASRWGAWAARRHWWVLGVWAVLLVGSSVVYPYLESQLVAPDYSVSGSDSDRVNELIQDNFTAAGSEQDVIVFSSDSLVVTDPAYRKVLDEVLADVRDEPGVASVLGPDDPGAEGQISADGHASLAAVGLSGDDSQRGGHAADIQDTIDAAVGDGPVEAYLAGISPSSNDVTKVETADVERAESFGLPVAFLVLLFALAALVAAFIPLALALSGVTVTFGVLTALTGVMDFDAFLLSIITMIGVGIGIDYSLFIISRFREELVRREDAPDAVPAAVGAAMTTSGRTVAFSGAIVAISLFSLFAVNSPLFHEMAIGAVLVVVCTLAAAWSLLPALLGALGHRINRGALPQRFQPAEDRPGSVDPARPEGTGFWARWAHTVLDHPWLAIPAAAVLIVLTLPVFGLKLGIDLGLAALADEPSGKAEIILADSFSEGAMSPVQVLVSNPDGGPLTTNDLEAVDRLTTEASRDPRVADAFAVTTMLRQAGLPLTAEGLATLEQSKDPAAATQLAQTVNLEDGADRTIVTLVPSVAIDSTKAGDLVNELRDETIPPLTGADGPEMLVGGASAQFVDLSDETLGKLWVVIGLVLTLSFLYLMVVFRSLLIPLKAVVMNLMATGAAFGLTAWVFEEGHLEGFFDFTSVGFVQVYLPIMTFALLFGLSMDYEVFLIRRMQEEWVASGDNERAVATGLAHTARPIAAAAAIMAAVFGCFLVADVLELKEFGLALAAAVVLDATLVRLLMVPAIMKIAGTANWWLPRWLQKILPDLRLD
ncbi:MMPL family transporter [Nocardioides koreensis]|uniref:MMPL family transporter n=1 Tax=Nocardioides koreensis TaxID=433651 RepID=A0ABN3A6Q2_9ACTN